MSLDGSGSEILKYEDRKEDFRVIIWSGDCLSCLCNLPHSPEEHNQNVEQASAERQQELAEMRWLIGNEDEESASPDPEQTEALKSIATAMFRALLREGM